MKQIIAIMFLALIPMSLMAQDNDEEEDTIRLNTKYGEIFYRKGEFSKFEDFKREKYPYQKLNSVNKIKIFIRKVYGTKQNYYFVKLQIGKCYNFVEYSDLVEINKALIKLKSEVDGDCSKQPEYLQNSFITDDDFEIGYWVRKRFGKYAPNWYIDFYHSITGWGLYYNSMDIDKIANTLQEIQLKIEEMMEADKK